MKFFILSSLLLFSTGNVLALSCRKPPTTLYAEYIDGKFASAFSVRQVLVGNVCSSRPKVEDAPADVENIFSIVAENMKIQIGSGVYRLKHSCTYLPGEADKNCLQTSRAELTLDRAPTITAIKAEWQEKEQEEMRSNEVNKWGWAGLIALVSAYLAFLPLIERRFSKNKDTPFDQFYVRTFRKQLVGLIAFAFFAIPFTMWSHQLWIRTLAGGIILILISLGIQLIYVIGANAHREMKK